MSDPDHKDNNSLKTKLTKNNILYFVLLYIIYLFTNYKYPLYVCTMKVTKSFSIELEVAAKLEKLKAKVNISNEVESLLIRLIKKHDIK